MSAPTHPVIQVLPSTSDAGRAAAAHVARLAGESAHRHGRFTIAFSGGSLLDALCPHLLSDNSATGFHWAAWHVFCVDERCVPLSDARSNFGSLREQLLRHVPIPPDQTYPVDTTQMPESAAAAYEAILSRVLRPPPPDAPRFDLILLGMGEDGHTASLFPGHPVLNETRRWVVALRDSPKPPPERVTMTLPVLNSAREVIFVVLGDGKTQALARALAPQPQADRVPAGRVCPARGIVTWYVDEAAARLLMK